MKVTYQGREYQLDWNDVNVRPAIVITGYTGLSVQGWIDALSSDADADGNVIADAQGKPGFLKALIALHWLMLQQSGEHADIADIDFPIGEFTAAVGDAMAADREARAAAAAAESEPEDPTRSPEDSARSPEHGSTTTRTRQRRTGGEGSPDG